MFSFDALPDRLAWSATKFERYRGRDILPLWIADMDFPIAPPIREALSRHLAHGNFGYMNPPPNLAEELAEYYARQYGWAIAPDWIVWLPGLVLGFNLAAKACCAEGEALLTLTPVYPPFLHAAATQGRVGLQVPLHEALGSDGVLRYALDLEAMEAAITPTTRLLLLCHPHNPVGKVFTPEEVRALTDFAARHQLIICSDEVHGDLILEPGLRHMPFAATLGERLAQSITLHGPGKTFNLPGLGLAWAIIPDPALRRRYRQAMQRLVPEPCGLGYTALQAALPEGEPWRQALLAQLRANRDQVATTLRRLSLFHTHPQATYLTWIDLRHWLPRVGNPAAWLETQGLGLSDGADFGAPGFVRLNFGTSATVLSEALERLERAAARV